MNPLYYRPTKVLFEPTPDFDKLRAALNRPRRKRNRDNVNREEVNYLLAGEINARLPKGRAKKTGAYGRVFIYGQVIKMWAKVGELRWDSATSRFHSK